MPQKKAQLDRNDLQNQTAELTSDSRSDNNADRFFIALIAFIALIVFVALINASLPVAPVLPSNTS
jgi:hypothetical protein